MINDNAIRKLAQKLACTWTSRERIESWILDALRTELKRGKTLENLMTDGSELKRRTSVTIRRKNK
jgi:hypothetical protein